MENAQIYSSDVAFTPAVKAIQTAEGLAPGLCPHGGRGLLGDHDNIRTCGLHRGANECLLCDRKQGGPALYPASRRPQRLSARARRENDWLHRLFGQPAIYQPGKPCRKSKSPSLSHRLCPSAADQDLGRGARRRGPRRPDGETHAENYKARPEQVILFTVSAWMRTAPSISRSALKPPMWRRPLPNATPASRRLKPRSNG